MPFPDLPALASSFLSSCPPSDGFANDAVAHLERERATFAPEQPFPSSCWTFKADTVHSEDSGAEGEEQGVDSGWAASRRALCCVCLRQQRRRASVRQEATHEDSNSGNTRADCICLWDRWVTIPALHAIYKDDAEGSHKLAIKVLSSGLSPVDVKADQEDILGFDVSLSSLAFEKGLVILMRTLST